MRARLREAHLPEACYEWEAMDTLSPPAPRRVRKRRLVRRIFARSVALLAWVRHRGAGPANGVRVAAAFSPARPVPNPDVIGPYIVSGGWWRRKIHREYYYVRARGGWLWVYYDHRRKRAFVQGQVG